MGESVIAEFVPFICDASNEIGISLSVLSDDEKCGLNILAFQNFENCRRPSWIRTIVEGQREQAGSIAGSLDDVGRRQLGELFRLDKSTCRIDLEIARAFLWTRHHLQQFA